MRYVLFSLIFIFNLASHANSKPANPQTMLVIIGAVKYYNQNCAGLNSSGFARMNAGLRYFKLDRMPVAELEKHHLAISGYKIANKFGCQGTRNEAQKAGFGQYLN